MRKTQTKEVALSSAVEVDDEAGEAMGHWEWSLSDHKVHARGLHL